MKTTFGELASNVGKVTPVAAKLEVSTKELMSSLASTTSQGLDTSESVTALKAAMSNVIKPGAEASKMAKKLGINFSASALKSKGWSKFLQEIKEKTGGSTEKMGKLFGSTEALNSVFMLTSNDGMKTYNDTMKEMNTNTHALDDAYKKIDTTKGEKLAKSWNKCKNKMIEVGDKLSPLIDSFSNLLNHISKINPKVLEMGVKLGAVTFGVGALGRGIGSTAQGFGTFGKMASWVVKHLSKSKIAVNGLSGATGKMGASAVKNSGKVGLLSKAVSGIKGTSGLATGGIAKFASTVGLSVPGLGLAVAGVAGLGVGAYKLHQHLKKECVPSIDLFNSKVKTTKTTTDQFGNKIKVAGTKVVKFSKGTKKAVGTFVKSSNAASKSIFKLCANSTKITAKMAKDIGNKYKKLGEQIKKGQDKKYKERLANFRIFLSKNKTMSDKDKADALKKMEISHKNEKNKIDNYTKRIQDILDNASKNHRKLSKDEQEEINKIQEKMKTEGVKKLSKTEEESKTILNRIKEYGTRITAEQASSVIKNAEKQRKESVDKANNQCTQTIANIKKMRDEDKSITKDQADKMIAEAKRQKEETVKKAEKQKEGVVGQIKEMNSDTLEDIDTTDGTIKTGWDKLKEFFTNNPITRWIKNKVSGDTGAEHNWTGNSYFKGGLTYLHDAPGKNTNYELYDLPRGTRIFNHDASQDLVQQTAKNVATEVANSVLKDFEGLENTNNKQQTIIVPVNLDGREIARITAKPMSEELGRLNRKGRLGYV